MPDRQRGYAHPGLQYPRHAMPRHVTCPQPERNYPCRHNLVSSITFLQIGKREVGFVSHMR
jgi:hypothetical protein